MLENFSSMLETFSTMLENFSSMLESFSTMLESFSSMLENFSRMLGSFSTMLESFSRMLGSFSTMRTSFSGYVSSRLASIAAVTATVAVAPTYIARFSSRDTTFTSSKEMWGPDLTSFSKDEETVSTTSYVPESLSSRHDYGRLRSVTVSYGAISIPIILGSAPYGFARRLDSSRV